MHIQWLEEGKDSFLEEITEGFPRKCCFLEFANLTLGETAEPIFLWTQFKDNRKSLMFVISYRFVSGWQGAESCVLYLFPFFEHKLP